MSAVTEKAAFSLLQQALQQVPEVALKRADAGADLSIRSQNRLTQLQFKKWQPEVLSRREAKHVIWILRNATSEVHNRLRRADVNFIDLSGVVRLHLSSLLIDRTDLAPVSARSEESRNPFSDRTSRVPRVLFEHYSTGERLSVQDVAQMADLPLSTTSYAIKELENLGVVDSTRVGRSKGLRLRELRSLIQQWALKYSWKENQLATFDAPVGDLERFLRRLNRSFHGHRWALTLQAGASRLVPHATWNTVHLYVDLDKQHDLARIGDSIGWQPATEGRVILMDPYYQESLWKGVREVGRLPVVSDLQLILDLWHYPVRGREQAELLLEKLGRHARA